MPRLLLGAALSLLFGTLPLSAQTLTSLYSARSPNQQNLGYFGRFVEPAGDANADGVPDLLVSAYNEAGNTGRVYYLSGTDGTAIRTFESPVAMTNGFFGISVAPTGDVNGDGTPDFLAGSYHPVGGLASAGQAYVISGADGAVLQTLASPDPEENGLFSFDLTAPGDLDGDGIGDYVVMSGDEDVLVDGNELQDHGAGYAFSGADGSVLWQSTPQTLEAFIYYGRVAPAGDLTGDGVPDLVTSAVLATDSDGIQSGLAYAVDGSDGSILYTMQSGNNVGNANGSFGFSLAGLGDLTGDGVPDLAVGTPFEGVGGTSVRDGTVSFFSGADGSRLGTYALDERQAERRFGWEVSPVGDLDGDGVSDIGVSAVFEFNAYEFIPPPFSAPNSGALFIYSGAAIGQEEVDEIAELFPPLPNFPVDFRWQFGEDFNAIGDIDGDGLPDLAVGVPGQGAEIGFVGVYPGARLLAISDVGVDAEAELVVEGDGTYDFGETGVDLALAGTTARPSASRRGRLVAVEEASAADAEADAARGEGITVRVERHQNAPNDISAIAEANVAGYRWLAVSEGDFAFGAASEIRFRLDDVPDAGIDDGSTVVVYRRETLGTGAFEALPTTYDAVTNTLIATGFSRLGEFTFASDTNPLPTETEVANLGFTLTAFPNPVRDRATLHLTVPTPQPVRVAVFDVLGRRVAVLHDGPLAPGAHPLSFDGRGLPSGTYVVRVAAGDFVEARRVTLVR